MQAGSEASSVEAYAASWVFPFLLSKLPEGATMVPVPNNIGMQHRHADAWVRTQDGEAFWVELKSEQKHTGNLFIEQFSNLKTGTVGWLYHYHDDTILAYAFNDTHTLYTCRFGALRAWAFGESKHPESLSHYRLEDFNSKGQSKYEQNNEPLGFIVPVDFFLSEVEGAKRFRCNTKKPAEVS